MTVEIFVLGVLHDHEKHQGYTFWHLTKILDLYQPDLIMIEAGPRAIKDADFRSFSPERWGVILPWGQERGIAVMALDGDPIGRTKSNEEQAVAFADAEESKEKLVELNEKIAPILESAGDLNSLFDSYTKINSKEVQALFRQTHSLNEEIMGIGPQSYNWTPRNRSMVKATLNAIRTANAHRVIVTVGGEHKYALDEMFAAIDGIKVLQLADFATGPVTLTTEERDRFLKGDSPIIYPNELMLIHRRLHGGEPYSYMQTLYPEPDRLDVNGILEIIDTHLTRKDDPQMHYYRGLYFYYVQNHQQAVLEFDLARRDMSIMSCLILLWELATLRLAQMLNLLDRREEALTCYQQILADGTTLPRREILGYLVNPFVRPSSHESGTNR